MIKKPRLCSSGLAFALVVLISSVVLSGCADSFFSGTAPRTTADPYLAYSKLERADLLPQDGAHTLVELEIGFEGPSVDDAALAKTLLAVRKLVKRQVVQSQEGGSDEQSTVTVELSTAQLGNLLDALEHDADVTWVRPVAQP